jgi:serine/threonine protein kinase
LFEQIAIGGAKSKDYFDRHGDLKRIRRLKYWPLDRLLIDKYKLPEAEAKEFAEFLTPILEFAPEKRPTAQQCLDHPWMNVTTQNDAENVDDQMNNLHIKG